MDKIAKSNNVLLKKDDVGRGKPTTFTLPAKDFVYGKPEFTDQPGVGVLTTQW